MRKGIIRKSIPLVAISAGLFLSVISPVAAQDEAATEAPVVSTEPIVVREAPVDQPQVSPAQAAIEQETIAEQEMRKIETAGQFRQDVQKVVVEKDEYPFNMESYARYMPKSSVDVQDGSVGLIDTAAQWSYEHKFFDRLPVEFSLEQSYIGINNSTAVKVPARLTGISFGIDTTLPLVMTKNLYFRVGVSPTFNTDNWSLYENALRLPQRYMAIWQPNDKFTAILGAAYMPRYRTSFVPIAGIIYRPNDKWLFNLVPTRPTISYFVNKDLQVYGEYSLSGDEYVVTKDGIKGTVLEYDEQHAGLGMKYTLNKYMQASLGVGGTFGRKLQYRESYGKIKIDPGVYSEFRLEARM